MAGLLGDSSVSIFTSYRSSFTKLFWRGSMLLSLSLVLIGVKFYRFLSIFRDIRLYMDLVHRCRIFVLLRNTVSFSFVHQPTMELDSSVGTNSTQLPICFCVRTNVCFFEQLTRIIEPLSGQLNSINFRHRLCAA